MVLDDEQANRFFDTMDALLYFVNARLRVVEGFNLDSLGVIDDMRAGLVARALWDNVEIIDQFVAENPGRLSRACLELAMSWKSALPDLYTLVRYQGGRALLMGQAGVFSVCGVTEGLADEIGPAPAYVEMVLLPFDDLIVYDGFLQAYDLEGTAGERAHIQDEFENRCAAGIVSTGEEFARIAGGFLAERRDEELDALLADVAREADPRKETLPAGFHRGALAGLSPLERDAVMAQVLGERGAGRDVFGPTSEDAPVSQDAWHANATAGLDELVSGEAPDGREGAHAQGPAGGRGLSSAESLDSRGGASARAAATGRDAPLPEGGGSTPEGNAPEGAAFDIRGEQALNCAVACVLARGAVPLDEAYEQYRVLVADAISRGDFAAIMRDEASYSDAELGIWPYQGRDYLVHYTLTPDFIAQQASQGGWMGGGDWRGLPAELEQCESFKRGLVESRGEVAPRPLSRALLETSAVGELLGDPSVMRLRAFLDERVPDGEDDYTFADRAVSDIALASIETGSLGEVLRFADDLGLSGCSEDEERLVALVTNVFNAMPSWENNGWSPQELYEQLTGRKMFYNEDGSVMRLSPDDACPCGSGRRYGQCCGG